MLYCIIETDNGLQVVDYPDGEKAEDAAIKHNGVLIDAHPYKKYDDAYDALLARQMEDDDETSDEPPVVD